MFTGIVEEVGSIISITGPSLGIRAHKVIKQIEAGASIAVNGTCLTVTRFDKDGFVVDVMEETLKRTNLGALKPGDPVNLEGALTLSKGLGGHLVEGHIDATGHIISITPRNNSLIFEINAPSEVMRYVVEKGFIAVNGISLTIVESKDTSFLVSIVGFTIKNTNLGTAKPGDAVNLEADIIAKYVERYVSGKKGGITEGFLKEYGFV
jgi:riboflavin synthase